MNQELIDNVGITISEAHSRAILKMRNAHKEYLSMTKKIESTIAIIEQVLSSENLDNFKQLFVALENRAFFEQRYMYIQGFKDYSNVMNYLNDGALEKYTLDYDFKFED